MTHNEALPVGKAGVTVAVRTKSFALQQALRTTFGGIDLRPDFVCQDAGTDE